MAILKLRCNTSMIFPCGIFGSFRCCLSCFLSHQHTGFRSGQPILPGLGLGKSRWADTDSAHTNTIIFGGFHLRDLCQYAGIVHSACFSGKTLGVAFSQCDNVSRLHSIHRIHRSVCPRPNTMAPGRCACGIALTVHSVLSGIFYHSHSATR